MQDCGRFFIIGHCPVYYRTLPVYYRALTGLLSDTVRFSIGHCQVYYRALSGYKSTNLQQRCQSAVILVARNYTVKFGMTAGNCKAMKFCL